MRSRALEYLGCPECRSELETGRVRTWKGDIRSGNLICRRCGLDFPIVVGRPVLLGADSIDHWKAPIDEALGVDDPAIPPLSIPRLVSLGIDKALQMAETEKVRQSIQTHTKMKSILEIPEAVIGKMKYRDSGKWFRYLQNGFHFCMSLNALPDFYKNEIHFGDTRSSDRENEIQGLGEMVQAWKPR